MVDESIRSLLVAWIGMLTTFFHVFQRGGQGFPEADRDGYLMESYSHHSLLLNLANLCDTGLSKYRRHAYVDQTKKRACGTDGQGTNQIMNQVVIFTAESSNK